MADSTEEKLAPIIYVIKKKKGGHGGHHGGAWKVAYADFVTAMMALFIVLWLLSSSAEVKKAIGGYFQDPTGVGRLQGNSAAGTGDALELKKTDLHKVKELLQQAIQQMVEFKKAKENILMTVTGEGLRIELIEDKKGMFFESGKVEPSEVGRELLITLAKELGTLPNRILIEGHTDAKPFGSNGNYSNWELSVDRGNAARRVMESAGLRPNQVMEIRGFADQDLRTPKDPEGDSNRRISVIVKYAQPAAADLVDADAKPDPKAKASGAGKTEAKLEKGKSDGKPEATKTEAVKKTDVKPEAAKVEPAAKAEAKPEAKPVAAKVEPPKKPDPAKRS